MKLIYISLWRRNEMKFLRYYPPRIFEKVCGLRQKYVEKNISKIPFNSASTTQDHELPYVNSESSVLYQPTPSVQLLSDDISGKRY